jgi:hypothetical protein
MAKTDKNSQINVVWHFPNSNKEITGTNKNQGSTGEISPPEKNEHVVMDTKYAFAI